MKDSNDTIGNRIRAYFPVIPFPLGLSPFLSTLFLATISLCFPLRILTEFSAHKFAITYISCLSFQTSAVQAADSGRNGGKHPSLRSAPNFLLRAVLCCQWLSQVFAICHIFATFITKGTSGFRGDKVKAFVLLRCYVVKDGSKLLTFRTNLSIPSLRMNLSSDFVPALCLCDVHLIFSDFNSIPS